MVDFERIKREVSEVARSNGALKAIVFGSYARGTATRRSDLDVVIIENTSLPFLKRIDRYFDPLFDRLNLAIEILVYTPQEFDNIRHRHFIQTVLREGIVVYESGKQPEGSTKVAGTSQK
jgi:predicted nucleotidyltransferase